MNIGHYMPGVWDQGGIAKYLQRVSRAQRDAGHTVRFFDSRPDYAEFANPDERPIILAPQELGARAKSLGVDVLHLHTGTDPSPLGVGVPVVRTVHEHRPYCPSGERYLHRQGRPCDRLFHVAGCLKGHYVDQCGSRHPRRALANLAATRSERRTLTGMTVVAISHYVREQMIRNGYDGARIHVLHNPAPEPRPYGPPPTEGVPRFLFLGRIVSNKGLEWLLRSMAAVRVPIALDVAGEGPLRVEMEQLAAELGLKNSAIFHGWLDDDAIDLLAARARGVVFPPVWHEPAGLACMDGSARGRAVIASRSGGLAEYAIEGKNALVVPIHDTVALTHALTRLAEDWSLAAELGRTGHAMAQGPFSLGVHLQSLERIYREQAR